MDEEKKSHGLVVFCSYKHTTSHKDIFILKTKVKTSSEHENTFKWNYVGKVHLDDEMQIKDVFLYF